MKRSALLLFTAFIIILTSAVISSFSVSAANTNVVYVASNGTGDGSSPDSPLGNSKNYKPGNKMEIYNSFYLGLDKLKQKGGTLVIVGEVYIDSVESRFSNGRDKKIAPSEFRTPKAEKGISITITSVYNNSDYRKNGAKLILDHDTCNTTCVMFKSNTLIDNINIEYKYHEDYPNSWGTPFMFGGNGSAFEIGENVNVSSFNTKTNTEGNLYPILIGGHRYSELKSDTNLTVKSGTWSTVIAGGFGIASFSYGKIDGNANVIINGGKIDTLVGTGSLEQPAGSVTGNVNIVITAGEVKNLYVANSAEYSGTGAKITLGKNANIGSFYYAPDNYDGDIDSLVKKTSIANNSSLKIDIPENKSPETKAPESKPVSTKAPETQIPVTTPDETVSDTTVQPVDTTVPETQSSDINSEKGSGKTVLILLIIVSIVIGIFSFVINRIKLNMLK